MRFEAPQSPEARHTSERGLSQHLFQRLLAVEQVEPHLYYYACLKSRRWQLHPCEEPVSPRKVTTSPCLDVIDRRSPLDRLAHTTKQVRRSTRCFEADGSEQIANKCRVPPDRRLSFWFPCPVPLSSPRY